MNASASSTDGQVAKPTRYRWLVLTMIFLAYMIAGADRANLGVAIPYMKKEFHFSNTDVGAAASLFFVSYALIQVPAGLIYQRVGVRFIIGGALLLTSLSTYFVGLSASVLQLKIARTVLGAAEGPINVGILATINRWFPAREKGTAVGVFMAAIKFAPAAVPPIAAAIIFALGWREVFYLFAAPGILIAALWVIFVQDDPRRSRFVNQAEADYIEIDGATGHSDGSRARQALSPWLQRLIREKSIPLLASSGQVLGSWNIWACAVGYGLMAGLTATIMTWVPTYLVEVKHYPVFSMGFVASAPWVGACIGNIMGGLLSDRFFGERRKPVMLITAASTIVTMFALMQSPQDPLSLSCVFVLTGVLLNLGYSTFLAYPMSLVEKSCVPFAVAIVNTIGALGSAFAPFMVGLILDHYNWSMAFAFMSACSLVTLLIVCTMVEPSARTAAGR